ncbi:hypothetical protein EJB05_51805, partial [Eragrostis curvula]
MAFTNRASGFGAILTACERDFVFHNSGEKIRINGHISGEMPIILANTRGVLRKRNMQLDDYKCEMCLLQRNETIYHLFLRCPFAQNCWAILGVQTPRTNDAALAVQRIKRQLNVPFFMEVIILMSWSIWMRPNSANCKEKFKHEFAMVHISEFEGKYVGLYFMVSGYGPVDEFTAIYEKLNEVGEKFEVVVVALDTDESWFSASFVSIPWLAIPHGDKMCEKLLRDLPTLVLIGLDRKTLNNNVADIIEDHGVEAWEGFPFNSEMLETFAMKAKAK